MPTTIETRIRHELNREAARIERIRLDASRLAPELRARHAEIVAALDDAWHRACSAIDRLATAVGDEAGRASREFEEAWNELKTRMRRVRA